MAYLRKNPVFPIEEARALYERGLSLKQVAVELPSVVHRWYTAPAVRYRLLQAGVQMRSRGGATTRR